MTVLVAVVPSAKAEAMRASSIWWTPGRTNGLTMTLERTFPDDVSALSVARRLPKSIVWSLDGNWVR